MTAIREWINLVEITITEEARGTYRLFHGSYDPNIEKFRFDNLRHRTGTPGTLGFTTSPKTARIYGQYIYEVEVEGTFGDFEDPQDVERVFEWRYNDEANRYRNRVVGQGLHGKITPEELPSRLERLAQRLRLQITAGNYEWWENVSLWQAMGWDGAWCFESGSRNLIVGRGATVRMIGRLS